jgi:hypothetical protein
MTIPDKANQIRSREEKTMGNEHGKEREIALKKDLEELLVITHCIIP